MNVCVVGACVVNDALYIQDAALSVPSNPSSSSGNEQGLVAMSCESHVHALGETPEGWILHANVKQTHGYGIVRESAATSQRQRMR